MSSNPVLTATNICVINGGGRLGRHILKSLVNIREKEASKFPKLSNFKIHTFVTMDKRQALESESFVSKLDSIKMERTDIMERRELVCFLWLSYVFDGT